MTTPEAASPLPLKGATPAARQSRFRGVRWAYTGALTVRIDEDALEAVI